MMYTLQGCGLSSALSNQRKRRLYASTFEETSFPVIPSKFTTFRSCVRPPYPDITPKRVRDSFTHSTSVLRLDRSPPTVCLSALIGPCSASRSARHTWSREAGYNGPSAILEICLRASYLKSNKPLITRHIHSIRLSQN